MYKFICANINKSRSFTSSYRKLAQAKKIHQDCSRSQMIAGQTGTEDENQDYKDEDNGGQESATPTPRSSPTRMEQFPVATNLPIFKPISSTPGVKMKESPKFYTGNCMVVNHPTVSISKKYFHVYSFNPPANPKSSVSRKKFVNEEAVENYKRAMQSLYDIELKKPESLLNDLFGKMRTKRQRKKSSKTEIRFPTHTVKHNLKLHKRYKLREGRADRKIRMEPSMQNQTFNPDRVTYSKSIEKDEEGTINKTYLPSENQKQFEPSVGIEGLLNAMKTRTERELRVALDKVNKEDYQSLEEDFQSLVKSHPIIENASTEVKMKLKTRFIQLLQKSVNKYAQAETAKENSPKKKVKALLETSKQGKVKALIENSAQRKVPATNEKATEETPVEKTGQMEALVDSNSMKKQIEAYGREQALPEAENLDEGPHILMNHPQMLNRQVTDKDYLALKYPKQVWVIEKANYDVEKVCVKETPTRPALGLMKNYTKEPPKLNYKNIEHEAEELSKCVNKYKKLQYNKDAVNQLEQGSHEHPLTKLEKLEKERLRCIQELEKMDKSFVTSKTDSHSKKPTGDNSRFKKPADFYFKQQSIINILKEKQRSSEKVRKLLHIGGSSQAVSKNVSGSVAPKKVSFKEQLKLQVLTEANEQAIMKIRKWKNSDTREPTDNAASKVVKLPFPNIEKKGPPATEKIALHQGLGERMSAQALIKKSEGPNKTEAVAGLASRNDEFHGIILQQDNMQEENAFDGIKEHPKIDNADKEEILGQVNVQENNSSGYIKEHPEMDNADKEGNEKEKSCEHLQQETIQEKISLEEQTEIDKLNERASKSMSKSILQRIDENLALEGMVDQTEHISQENAEKDENVTDSQKEIEQEQTAGLEDSGEQSHGFHRIRTKEEEEKLRKKTRDHAYKTTPVYKPIRVIERTQEKIEKDKQSKKKTNSIISQVIPVKVNIKPRQKIPVFNNVKKVESSLEEPSKCDELNYSAEKLTKKQQTKKKKILDLDKGYTLYQPEVQNNEDKSSQKRKVQEIDLKIEQEEKFNHDLDEFYGQKKDEWGQTDSGKKEKMRNKKELHNMQDIYWKESRATGLEKKMEQEEIDFSMPSGQCVLENKLPTEQLDTLDNKHSINQAAGQIALIRNTEGVKKETEKVKLENQGFVLSSSSQLTKSSELKTDDKIRSTNNDLTRGWPSSSNILPPKDHSVYGTITWDSKTEASKKQTVRSSISLESRIKETNSPVRDNQVLSKQTAHLIMVIDAALTKRIVPPWLQESDEALNKKYPTNPPHVNRILYPALRQSNSKLVKESPKNEASYAENMECKKRYSLKMEKFQRKKNLPSTDVIYVPKERLVVNDITKFDDSAAPFNGPKGSASESTQDLAVLRPGDEIIILEEAKAAEARADAKQSFKGPPTLETAMSDTKRLDDALSMGKQLAVTQSKILVDASSKLDKMMEKINDLETYLKKQDGSVIGEKKSENKVRVPPPPKPPIDKGIKDIKKDSPKRPTDIILPPKIRGSKPENGKRETETIIIPKDDPNRKNVQSHEDKKLSAPVQQNFLPPKIRGSKPENGKHETKNIIRPKNDPNRKNVQSHEDKKLSASVQQTFLPPKIRESKPENGKHETETIPKDEPNRKNVQSHEDKKNSVPVQQNCLPPKIRGSKPENGEEEAKTIIIPKDDLNRKNLQSHEDKKLSAPVQQNVLPPKIRGSKPENGKHETETIIIPKDDPNRKNLRSHEDKKLSAPVQHHFKSVSQPDLKLQTETKKLNKKEKLDISEFVCKNPPLSKNKDAGATNLGESHKKDVKQIKATDRSAKHPRSNDSRIPMPVPIIASVKSQIKSSDNSTNKIVTGSQSCIMDGKKLIKIPKSKSMTLKLPEKTTDIKENSLNTEVEKLVDHIVSENKAAAEPPRVSLVSPPSVPNRTDKINRFGSTEKSKSRTATCPPTSPKIGNKADAEPPRVSWSPPSVPNRTDKITRSGSTEKSKSRTATCPPTSPKIGIEETKIKYSSWSIQRGSGRQSNIYSGCVAICTKAESKVVKETLRSPPKRSASSVSNKKNVPKKQKLIKKIFHSEKFANEESSKSEPNTKVTQSEKGDLQIIDQRADDTLLEDKLSSQPTNTDLHIREPKEQSSTDSVLAGQEKLILQTVDQSTSKKDGSLQSNLFFKSVKTIDSFKQAESKQEVSSIEDNSKQEINVSEAVSGLVQAESSQTKALLEELDAPQSKTNSLDDPIEPTSLVESNRTSPNSFEPQGAVQEQEHSDSPKVILKDNQAIKVDFKQENPILELSEPRSHNKDSGQKADTSDSSQALPKLIWPKPIFLSDRNSKQIGPVVELAQAALSSEDKEDHLETSRIEPKLFFANKTEQEWSDTTQRDPKTVKQVLEMAKELAKRSFIEDNKDYEKFTVPFKVLPKEKTQSQPVSNERLLFKERSESSPENRIVDQQSLDSLKYLQNTITTVGVNPATGSSANNDAIQEMSSAIETRVEREDSDLRQDYSCVSDDNNATEDNPPKSSIHEQREENISDAFESHIQDSSRVSSPYPSGNSKTSELNIVGISKVGHHEDSSSNTEYSNMLEFTPTGISKAGQKCSSVEDPEEKELISNSDVLKRSQSGDFMKSKTNPELSSIDEHAKRENEEVVEASESVGDLKDSLPIPTCSKYDGSPPLSESTGPSIRPKILRNPTSAGTGEVGNTRSKVSKAGLSTTSVKNTDKKDSMGSQKSSDDKKDKKIQKKRDSDKTAIFRIQDDGEVFIVKKAEEEPIAEKKKMALNPNFDPYCEEFVNMNGKTESKRTQADNIQKALDSNKVPTKVESVPNERKPSNNEQNSQRSYKQSSQQLSPAFERNKSEYWKKHPAKGESVNSKTQSNKSVDLKVDSPITKQTINSYTSNSKININEPQAVDYVSKKEPLSKDQEPRLVAELKEIIVKPAKEHQKEDGLGGQSKQPQPVCVPLKKPTAQQPIMKENQKQRATKGRTVKEKQDDYEFIAVNRKYSAMLKRIEERLADKRKMLQLKTEQIKVVSSFLDNTPKSKWRKEQGSEEEERKFKKVGETRNNKSSTTQSDSKILPNKTDETALINKKKSTPEFTKLKTHHDNTKTNLLNISQTSNKTSTQEKDKSNSMYTLKIPTKNENKTDNNDEYLKKHFKGSLYILEAPKFDDPVPSPKAKTLENSKILKPRPKSARENIEKKHSLPSRPKSDAVGYRNKHPKETRLHRRKGGATSVLKKVNKTAYSNVVTKNNDRKPGTLKPTSPVQDSKKLDKDQTKALVMKDAVKPAESAEAKLPKQQSVEKLVTKENPANRSVKSVEDQPKAKIKQYSRNMQKTDLNLNDNKKLLKTSQSEQVKTIMPKRATINFAAKKEKTGKIGDVKPITRAILKVLEEDVNNSNTPEAVWTSKPLRMRKKPVTVLTRMEQEKLKNKDEIQRKARASRMEMNQKKQERHSKKRIIGEMNETANYLNMQLNSEAASTNRGSHQKYQNDTKVIQPSDGFGPLGKQLKKPSTEDDKKKKFHNGAEETTGNAPLMSRAEFLRLRRLKMESLQREIALQPVVNLKNLDENLHSYIDRPNKPSLNPEPDLLKAKSLNAKKHAELQIDLYKRVQREIEININKRPGLPPPSLTNEALHFKINKMAKLIADNMNISEEEKQVIQMPIAKHSSNSSTKPDSLRPIAEDHVSTSSTQQARQKSVEKMMELKQQNKLERQMKTANAKSPPSETAQKEAYNIVVSNSNPNRKDPQQSGLDFETDSESISVNTIILKPKNLTLKKGKVKDKSKPTKIPKIKNTHCERIVLPMQKSKLLASGMPECPLESTLDKPVGAKIKKVPKGFLERAGKSSPYKPLDQLGKFRHLKITYMTVKRPAKKENETFLPHFEEPEIDEEKNKIINIRYELLKRLHEEFQKQQEAKKTPSESDIWKPKNVKIDGKRTLEGDMNSGKVLDTVKQALKPHLKTKTEIVKGTKKKDSKKSSDFDKKGPGGVRRYSTDRSSCSGKDNKDDNSCDFNEKKIEICQVDSECTERQSRDECENSQKEIEVPENVKKFNIIEELPDAFTPPHPCMEEERQSDLYHRYHKWTFSNLHEHLAEKRVSAVDAEEERRRKQCQVEESRKCPDDSDERDSSCK